MFSNVFSSVRAILMLLNCFSFLEIRASTLVACGSSSYTFKTAINCQNNFLLQAMLILSKVVFENSVLYWTTFFKKYDFNLTE